MGSCSFDVNNYLVVFIVESVDFGNYLKLSRFVVSVSEVFKVVDCKVFIYLAFSAY